MKPVGFRTGYYFTGGIMFLGVALVLPGIFISKIHILATLPFFLVSVIILTTHYGLEIDITRKLHREYVWLMGLKFGPWEPFMSMEYIFIKKNRVAQTMHSLLNAHETHSEEYDAYLKFTETDKVHLGSAKRKEKLIKRMQGVAHQLQLDIIEYSDKSK